MIIQMSRAGLGSIVELQSMRLIDLVEYATQAAEIFKAEQKKLKRKK